ncbi:MAG: LptA/OstA family protein [Gammaproteobacteria bacterium]
MRTSACLVLAVFSVFALAPLSHAQLANSSLPIEMEADSTGADARTGKVTFTNISIKQGALSIVANHAETSTLDFDDSTWVFRGNVKLNAPESALNATRMTLRFANKQIQQAILTGTPLQYTDNQDNGTRVVAEKADLVFSSNAIAKVELTGTPIEMSRAATEDSKRTEGRANSITYDAATNNLSLSGDAELGEGPNRITGNQITYNLQNRQVLAAANEQGDGKVYITINPTADDQTGQSATEADDADENRQVPETNTPERDEDQPGTPE